MSFAARIGFALLTAGGLCALAAIAYAIAAGIFWLMTKRRSR